MGGNSMLEYSIVFLKKANIYSSIGVSTRVVSQKHLGPSFLFRKLGGQRSLPIWLGSGALYAVTKCGVILVMTIQVSNEVI